MPDPLVLYEVAEEVGIVTLNRPEKLNAISAELQEQLSDAFARMSAEGVPAAVKWRAAQFRE
jgi:enoyl-CoA hydratase/carnithine racemase